MWKRLSRRTFAPRRPAVFPEQWPLAVVTILTLLASIALVLYALIS